MKQLRLRYQKHTVAIIDIGTNSTKLLIASTTPTGLIRPHKFLKRTTRLGVAHHSKEHATVDIADVEQVGARAVQRPFAQIATDECFGRFDRELSQGFRGGPDPALRLERTFLDVDRSEHSLQIGVSLVQLPRAEEPRREQAQGSVVDASGFPETIMSAMPTTLLESNGSNREIQLIIGYQHI